MTSQITPNSEFHFLSTKEREQVKEWFYSHPDFPQVDGEGEKGFIIRRGEKPMSLKFGFFYTHSRTEETEIEKVQKSLAAVGWEAEMTCTKCQNSWPKDSYFQVDILRVRQIPVVVEEAPVVVETPEQTQETLREWAEEMELDAPMDVDRDEEAEQHLEDQMTLASLTPVADDEGEAVSPFSLEKVGRRHYKMVFQFATYEIVPVEGSTWEWQILDVTGQKSFPEKRWESIAQIFRIFSAKSGF